MTESSGRTALPSISVVIPLHDEEQVLAQLLKTVSAVLEGLPRPESHEILCVDDGSVDGTLDLLLEKRSTYPNLRVLSLSRNFGHQAALSAALDHALGDAIFIIDGDLQDDPEALPQFIDEYMRGADVVYATRRDRNESLWLRAAYAIHYRLLALMSETDIPVDAGDFSLLSRKAVEILTGLPERQRYLRGLRAWIGLKQVGVPVPREERFAGKSKYSVWDLISLSMSGLFAFTVIPLRVATVVGGVTVLAGTGYGVYVIVDRITGGPPQGFATLALLQIVFAGMILLVLGVIGEYIGRIFEEVKRRPAYIVANEWGRDDDDG